MVTEKLPAKLFKLITMYVDKILRKYILKNIMFYAI